MEYKFRRHAHLYKLAGLLAALSIIAACAFVPPCYAAAQGQAPFTDVEPGDPNFIFINYAKNIKLAGGDPEGTFRPGDPLTRAEALAMILKAGGKEGLSGENADNQFTDVPPDHWAAGLIGTAVSMGLVSGYDDGTFHAEKPVTRAEAVLMLFRWAGSGVPREVTAYTPDLVEDHWAAGAVSAGLEAGLLRIDENGNSRPDGAITRGDFCRALALTHIQRPGAGKVPLKATLSVEKGPVWVETGGPAAPAEGMLSARPGMTVKTGSGAEAEILFEDGSSLRLEENTTMTILTMSGTGAIGRDGSPVSSIDSLKIRLDEGRLFGVLSSPHMFNADSVYVSKAGRDGRFPRGLMACAGGCPGFGLPGVLLAMDDPDSDEPSGSGEQPWYLASAEKRVRVTVDMPWSVGGIRGTFWMNEVTASGQATNVLRGEAVVGAGGRTVVLREGQSTAVSSSGGRPSDPKPMSPAEAGQWVKKNQWVENRAKSVEKIMPINSATLKVALPGEKRPVKKGAEINLGSDKTADKKGLGSSFDLPSALKNSIKKAAGNAGIKAEQDQGQKTRGPQGQGQGSVKNSGGNSSGNSGGNNGGGGKSVGGGGSSGKDKSTGGGSSGGGSGGGKGGGGSDKNKSSKNPK